MASPRRSTTPDSAARRILAWVAGAMSPISSRNRVPPCASSNLPGRELVAPGERAFHVAEQFALDQRLGNRRAVEGHEALPGACAAGVDLLGQQILARAAFAQQQHGQIGLGDPRRPERNNSRIVRDIPIMRPNCPSAASRSRKHCTSVRRRWRSRARLTTSRSFLHVVRLGQVIVGAGLHGLDGDPLRSVRRDHDDGRGGGGLADLAQQDQAVLAREVVVEQDHIRAIGREAARPAATLSASTTRYSFSKTRASA